MALSTLSVGLHATAATGYAPRSISHHGEHDGIPVGEVRHRLGTSVAYTGSGLCRAQSVGPVAGEVVEGGVAAGEQEQERPDGSGDVRSLPPGPVGVSGNEPVSVEGDVGGSRWRARCAGVSHLRVAASGGRARLHRELEYERDGDVWAVDEDVGQCLQGCHEGVVAARADRRP